jgi:hypothetical protein
MPCLVCERICEPHERALGKCSIFNGLEQPQAEHSASLGSVTYVRFAAGKDFPAAANERQGRERNSTMPKLAFALAAIAAVAFTAGAYAQSQKVAIPPKTFYKGQESTQYLAKDRLIGAKVRNKDGQIIGDIEDVIVASDNRVEGVIMGVGGFLGVGEKKVGVRYAALRFETKDGKTTVTLPQATKEVLTALEPYKYAEPHKSVVERATEKAKELADKTKETVKDATQKATDAAKDAYNKATANQSPEKKQ